MNDTTQTYLVTLAPLAPFFFGGEQGDTADYFLKGSFFPQQTALLGLVRHQLLIQNSLLVNGSIADKDKAASLIGAESFRYDRPQQFGCVHKLSECYIGYAEKGKAVGQETSLYHTAPQVYTRHMAQEGQNFVLPEYDPKEDYPALFCRLGDGTNGMPAITAENIFSSTERPGINKNYDGKPLDDAYYKQVWLCMKPGFSFAFYLTLAATYGSTNEAVRFDGSVVTFGKENAPFMLRVEPATMPPETDKPSEGENALYLTSDAYLPEDIGAGCAIAVTDTVPFRNIINQVVQDKSAYFNRRPAAIPSSKRLQLYKRGSFFYTDDIEALAQKIKLPAGFARIGYNTYHFTTIKISS